MSNKKKNKHFLYVVNNKKQRCIMEYILNKFNSNVNFPLKQIRKDKKNPFNAQQIFLSVYIPMYSKGT